MQTSCCSEAVGRSSYEMVEWVLDLIFTERKTQQRQANGKGGEHQQEIEVQELYPSIFFK